MAEELVIVLSGRTFRKTARTTLDQDAYVMRRMREFGLANIDVDPANPDLDGVAENLILRAFETGKMYEILGGMLVEDNVKWTRANAATNADFFRDLDTKADKQALYASISSVMLDFLVAAAEWSKTSRKSSPKSGEPTPVPQGLPAPEVTAAILNGTSENGIIYSGASLETNSTDSQ